MQPSYIHSIINRKKKHIFLLKKYVTCQFVIWHLGGLHKSRCSLGCTKYFSLSKALFNNYWIIFLYISGCIMQSIQVYNHKLPPGYMYVCILCSFMIGEDMWRWMFHIEKCGGFTTFKRYMNYFSRCQLVLRWNLICI